MLIPSTPHLTAPISALSRVSPAETAWWAPGSSLVKGTPEMMLLFLHGTPNLGFRAFPSLSMLWEGSFCGAKMKMSLYISLAGGWMGGRQQSPLFLSL